ncbi:ACP phosphodiesterase [Salinisphaera sp. T31B1]|uniref:acyl carrier protein phosphodiesterase n=1 Tax=Salinisphaera sp. T31B1 TaxID=727963 RepID=UPI00334192D5
MNLLAHCLLAHRSGTSFAGQILGDMIKGRLVGDYPAPIEQGIALHRAIDRISDDHPAHRDLRRQFAPPLRRYAGILVDIGFDASLARAWPAYHSDDLRRFTQMAQDQVIAEWPAHAPVPAGRMQGLGRVMADYQRPRGIQRALDSVASRLRRDNPVGEALPRLEALEPLFDEALASLVTDLEAHVCLLVRTTDQPPASAT